MAVFEIGAFTESDLLAQGTAGTNIGICDTFIMPATTSVCIEVYDNDHSISGDNYNNENANDQCGQTATITEDGVVTSSGSQIYAECYFWVRDECGNWYVMIEMELEGEAGDYFTFYNNVPPEGAELTIHCCRNVCGNWVKYHKLMEPDCVTPPLALDDVLTIAEDETGMLNILANDVDLDGTSISVTDAGGAPVGTPFVVLSAEGYPAMVTVDADGSMTVEPGPEFIQMTQDATTQLTFDYTITDSDGLTDTASVTITVTGKANHLAVDDALTVFESETSGDLETLDTGDSSILDNDQTDAAAYTGEVLAVDGDTGNVGQVVIGSNGGLATIYADGSIDFDANGAFDHLNNGDTAQTDFTYTIEGGQTATVTVTVQGEDDPNNGGGDPTINVALMINSALSMFEQANTAAFSLPGYQDWNNDTIGNQVMDMAYLMASDFMSDAHQAAQDAGYTLNLSLISFDGAATGEAGQYYSVADAASANAQLDAKIFADNSGDYSAGFANANAWFDTVENATSTNVVFFVGNGFSTAPFQTEYDALLADHNVIIDAYLPDADFSGTGSDTIAAIDRSGVVEEIFIDDEALAASFGVPAGQNALSLDEFLV